MQGRERAMTGSRAAFDRSNQRLMRGRLGWLEFVQIQHRRAENSRGFGARLTEPAYETAVSRLGGDAGGPQRVVANFFGLVDSHGLAFYLVALNTRAPSGCYRHAVPGEGWQKPGNPLAVGIATGYTGLLGGGWHPGRCQRPSAVSLNGAEVNANDGQWSYQQGDL